MRDTNFKWWMLRGKVNVKSLIIINKHLVSAHKSLTSDHIDALLFCHSVTICSLSGHRIKTGSSQTLANCILIGVIIACVLKTTMSRILVV